MDAIKPAQTEWVSLIVFVPKKDGTLHFCVHYGKLNAVTIQDSYQLLCMNERIDSIGDATTFLTLDANSRYWKVEIATKDRDRTTFTSHHCFLHLPPLCSHALRIEE